VKKTAFLVVSVMLLTITIVAFVSSVGVSEDKVLHVGIFDEPGTLDFMQQNGMPASYIDWNLYDQLIRHNCETEDIEGELAVNWYLETPTAYIVELRKGVQFHKGYGEMTAEDIVFTVNYVMKNDARIKFLFDGIESVEVVDKYTVRYNLDAPNTPFVMNTLQGFGGLVMSKAAYEEIGPDEFARNPIGTGPFQFEEWVAGDRIILSKFEQYWDPGYPKVDRVEFHFVPDDSVRLNLLLTGELDLIQGVPFKDMDRVEKLPGVKLLRAEGWNWDFITFGSYEGVLADKRLRQAISYAINRQEIVDNVYYGHAIPAEKPFPPGFLFENPCITMYPAEGDLTKAIELAAAAGVSTEHPITLRAFTATQEIIQRELLIISQQLKPIGINLAVEFYDIPTYNEYRLAPGVFMQMEDITIMSPDPDTAVKWFWACGAALIEDYCPEAIDLLIREGKTETDPEKRRAIYEQLQLRMLDDAWWIYTVHKDQVRGAAANLSINCISPSDDDLYLKYVELGDE